jgi:gliding motility-associated lipoprotein GldH
MRIYKYIFLFLTIILTTSCTKEKVVFQEKIEFDYLGWNRFKELTFSPEIEDVSATYIFKLNLRLTDKYAYNYLQIQLKKESTDGETYVRLFSLPIKDRNKVFLEKAKDGIYEINAILSNQMYFSKAGVYQITIEQLMPKFDAKGVKSVEFLVIKRKD